MNFNAEGSNQTNILFKLSEQNHVQTTEINEWKKLFEKAAKEAYDLKEENTTLKNNISLLYNTAKSEREKSSRKISELENQIDDLLFNKFRSDDCKPKDIPIKEDKKYDDEREKYGIYLNERDRRRSRSKQRKKISKIRNFFLENQLDHLEHNTSTVKSIMNSTAKKPLKSSTNPKDCKTYNDTVNYNRSDGRQVNMKRKSKEPENLRLNASSSNHKRRSISPECPF